MKAWRALDDGERSAEPAEHLVEMLGLPRFVAAKPRTPAAEQEPLSQPASPRIITEERAEEEEAEAMPHERPHHHDSTTPSAEGREIVLEGPMKMAPSRLAANAGGAIPAASSRLPIHPLEPLFRREHTRTLLTAVVSTHRREGAVVVREAVDLLARRQPVLELPRRLVATTRMGLALLVARWGLEPFSHDIVDLSDKLRRVAGKNGVGEWWIDEDFRVEARKRQRHAWPPAPGTPLVVVTASTDGLGALAAAVGRPTSPVVALIPGRPKRPPGLPRHVSLVAWDHRTRVGQVVRARRAGDRI